MDKAPLKIRDGRTVDAMTPMILSASRSTDIPSGLSKESKRVMQHGLTHSTRSHHTSLLRKPELSYSGQKIRNLFFLISEFLMTWD